MTDSVNEVVQHLRACADRLEELYAERPGERVYFPPKLGAARQPCRLSGQVRVADVADLVHYVADMLEE